MHNYASYCKFKLLSCHQEESSVSKLHGCHVTAQSSGSAGLGKRGRKVFRGYVAMLGGWPKHDLITVVVYSLNFGPVSPCPG